MSVFLVYCFTERSKTKMLEKPFIDPHDVQNTRVSLLKAASEKPGPGVMRPGEAQALQDMALEITERNAEASMVAGQQAVEAAQAAEQSSQIGPDHQLPPRAA
jgi:hypothetical protein